jgi:transposase
LFVAVLPCSGIIYVEPFRDEKLPSWVTGDVDAFQYLGGVAKTLVPDNRLLPLNESYCKIEWL